jgi:hypothetical protein
LQCGGAEGEEIGMKNTLNRGFTRYPLDTFISRVQTIVDMLTGNADFPTTDPPIASVATKLTDLTKANSNPNPAAREAGIELIRPQIEQMLDDLADNLEKTSHGDGPMLATTGFETRKATEQTDEAPEVPQNVRLRTTGTTGEVQVLFEPSARARAYEIQIALDPNVNAWTLYDVFSSSRNVILTGQPRAKDIWVRVRALGPHNTRSGWSDPATTLVS